MGIEELVVKHRLERGEIAAAHRRIALVLEGEDFLVAAHRQTSLAVSLGTFGAFPHSITSSTRPGHPSFAERGVTEYCRVPWSLWLDAGRPAHLGPFLNGVRDEFPQFGGRACKGRIAAQIGKTRLHFGVGQTRVDLLI